MQVKPREMSKTEAAKILSSAVAYKIVAEISINEKLGHVLSDNTSEMVASYLGAVEVLGDMAHFKAVIHACGIDYSKLSEYIKGTIPVPYGRGRQAG